MLWIDWCDWRDQARGSEKTRDFSERVPYAIYNLVTRYCLTEYIRIRLAYVQILDNANVWTSIKLRSR